jgi:hypothetical protein
VTRYFHGDIDEVRISKIARSLDYFRLGHATQKPGSQAIALSAATTGLASNKWLHQRRQGGKAALLPSRLGIQADGRVNRAWFLAYRNSK